ncbi:two pore domain potassium channel family protein [Mucilaginibacter sp. ZT4R22]|uniref:Two pore domain potassium channel family protein n=2 Tax=Mucilaginibacter pankratovii TaxID=2772110 RepID=A0ABR7WXH7_9SPHI|nr:two pore domain potassium channel family protein [Mucilaginibacter pankratovii]
MEIERAYLPVYLHIDRLILKELEVKEGEITFIGNFNYTDMYHSTPGKFQPTIYNYFFSLQTISKTVAKPIFFGQTRELFAYSNQDNPIDSKYLIPKSDTLKPTSIVLKDDQIENINNLIGYNQGLIINDSLKRMIYFSAVTISTIGYGDIVPIDDNLRLLVGFEAILGIVFIGLFINSFGEWLKAK